MRCGSDAEFLGCELGSGDPGADLCESGLEWYLREFIGPRLAPMERAGAGPGDIERFFTGLAAFFRTGRQAPRGCLMINSIAEHEGRSPFLGRRAQDFRDRLTAAFTNAMPGQPAASCACQQAQLLTATTFGIWLTARIDLTAAEQACDAAAASIRTWQQAPAPMAKLPDPDGRLRKGWPLGAP